MIVRKNNIKIDIFKNIDATVRGYPVERYFIVNEQREIDGMCLLKAENEKIKEEFSKLSGFAGWSMVSAENKDLYFEDQFAAQNDSSSETDTFRKLFSPGAASVEQVLKEEMTRSAQHRMPCSLMFININFIFKGQISKADNISYSVLHPITEKLHDSLQHEELPGLLYEPVVGETRKNYIYLESCFFVVLPDTGLNKAKRRFSQISKELLGIDKLQDGIKIIGIDAGLGVYKEGDSYSAEKLIEKTKDKLSESKKHGGLCVFSGHVKNSCQVTIEERNQLFAFLRNG